MEMIENKQRIINTIAKEAMEEKFLVQELSEMHFCPPVALTTLELTNF